MNAGTNRDISDDTLVLNCLEGNQQDIGVLYQRYYKNIYFLTRSIVKNKENAMDLTHDVFLKLFENLSSFRGDSKFSTWLYAITRNYCVEFLRKKNKFRFESVGASVQLAEAEFDWEEQAMYERKRELLNQEIEQAMERDQDILYQKYINRLSIKEIQEKFQLSESAVKMRLQRARIKIGRKIQYMLETDYYCMPSANIA